MELLQLRYFVALADSKNMTKTAEMLLISPSSLSLTISRLEREIGVQLFDRVGRKIVLNENGEVFLRHVQNSLGELDLGISKLKKGNSVNIITDTPGMWTTALSDFAKARPDIHLNSRVIKRSGIVPEMLLKEYDFWLAGSDSACKYEELIQQKLTASSLYLAVHDESPLAAYDSIKLSQLKNENFLFPSQGYQFHELYMRLCLDAGFEPNVVATCGFLMRMKMVATGNGISFVDEKSQSSDLFKHITYINIEDAPPIHSMSAYWHKSHQLSNVAKEFLKFINIYFQDQ